MNSDSTSRPTSAGTSGVEFRLSGAVTSEQVENLAARSQGRALNSIDIEGLRSTGFGSDARLLGWLARHNLMEGDSRPILNLDRGLTAGELPASATTTLAYFILGRMSKQTLSHGQDLSAHLLRAQKSALLGGTSRRLEASDVRAYFYDNQRPGLPVEPAIRPRPLAQRGTVRWVQKVETPPPSLAQLLAEDLEGLGLTDPVVGSEPPQGEFVRMVRIFVAEAMSNVRIHGTSDIDGTPINGLAFAAIRRFSYRDHPDAFMAAAGARREYLEKVADLTPGGAARLTFVEFTIADSGVGIPARYGGTAAIYGKPFREEATMLQRAFSMAEESPDNTGEGLGLFKIQGATKGLRALLSIRTGRSEATKHFLDDPEASLMSINVASQPRTLLGGTALSLLVPWTDLESVLPLGDV